MNFFLISGSCCMLKEISNSWSFNMKFLKIADGLSHRFHIKSPLFKIYYKSILLTRTETGSSVGYALTS